MSENTVIKDIIDRVIDVFYYSGNVIELLVAAVIAGNFIKRKSSSSLASAYFYILFFEYVLDALYELGFTCQRYLTKDYNSDNIIDLPFIKTFENIIEWYIMLFLGPANILLSLNRFTAIFVVTKHKTIWKTWFPVILLLLLLYPCIVGGYTFFTNIHCRLDIYASDCVDFFMADYYKIAYSNGICAIISLIIGISTATLYKIKLSNKIQNETNHLKIEHKLFLQSVWTSSLFGLFAFLEAFFPFFYEEKDNPEYFVWERIYGFAQDFAYISYHYFSIILLFIFSSALRTEFIKFYHLQWIFERNSKITVLTSVS